jgi:hypothetical protein
MGNDGPTRVPCGPIVDLRQYTLHSGQRDTLITPFDRAFVERQEALGARRRHSTRATAPLAWLRTSARNRWLAAVTDQCRWHARCGRSQGSRAGRRCGIHTGVRRSPAPPRSAWEYRSSPRDLVPVRACCEGRPAPREVRSRSTGPRVQSRMCCARSSTCSRGNQSTLSISPTPCFGRLTSP